MSSNINPLGPIKALVKHLGDRFDLLTRLPEVDARQTAEMFAHRYGLQPENVLAGNGTTQFIYSLPQALAPRRVGIAGPTYADYADACRRYDLKIEHCLSKEQDRFVPDIGLLERTAARCDTVFICNPNNPTGILIPGGEIKALCRKHPNTCFVVDESYLPFVHDSRRHSLIRELPDNAVVLHSLSKIFRIPGLRIGFLVAPADLVNQFRPWMLPWNVNALAQAAVAYLMNNRPAVDGFVDRTADFVREEREKLFQRIAARTQATLYPSETVFFLIRLPEGRTAPAIKTALMRHRLLVRDCSNFKGLSRRFIRISIKTADANRLLAEKLIEELNR